MESLGGDNGKIKPIKRVNKPHRIASHQSEMQTFIHSFVFGCLDRMIERNNAKKTVGKNFE